MSKYDIVGGGMAHNWDIKETDNFLKKVCFPIGNTCDDEPSVPKINNFRFRY